MFYLVNFYGFEIDLGIYGIFKGQFHPIRLHFQWLYNHVDLFFYKSDSLVALVNINAKLCYKEAGIIFIHFVLIINIHRII